jgi:hypothetical protein
VAIPTDLRFAAPFVQTLAQSGLHVLSVRGSTFMSMFQSTQEAVWIQTNQGIVDVVFFATPDAASRIRITQSPKATAGRFMYTIQAPSPILLHDQTIDAAFPLYFTVGHGVFMVTSSPQLDESLKRLFAVP